MTSAHDSDDIRILKKQCASLAKDAENDVYLVAKGNSYEYKNVKIVGIGSFSGGRVERMFKVSRAVYKKALEIDADIYELHDPELLLYVNKLKKKGKNVIFDSHEDYKKQIIEKQYIPKPVRRVVRFLYSILEDWACKSIDAALYPEENNPYMGKVKECVSIYNTPMVDELYPNVQFEEKEPSVCCVGTLSDIRGIFYLMQACYKAKTKLVLAGNFCSTEFEEKLKRDKAFSIVDYRGVCTREEVQQIYDECLIGSDTILRVGQYPFTENLSTKVYEYMLMKIPYITSDFDYNKMIIDKYNCGVCVDPANVDEIADAILFLRNNLLKAKEMGENGRKAVINDFNWETEERKLYNLYEKLYKGDL